MVLKFQAELMTIPNSNRERKPAALILESSDGSHETEDLSQESYYNSILSNEGTTVRKTYLLKVRTESDDQDSSYLMYGRNSLTDNTRLTAQPTPYGDFSVPFQRPGCIRGS